jgi:hypothetical protein
MKKVPAVAFGVVVLIGLAQAIDYPQMKEGLWSITMQIINNPGNVKTRGTQKLCRSHAYDDYARSLAKNTAGCKTVSENVSGGTYTIELECLQKGTTLKSKTVATLQGDSSVHSEGHTTYSPALRGVSEMTMMQDQKYVGSCPAGIMPGDRISEDGTVMHLWRH